MSRAAIRSRRFPSTLFCVIVGASSLTASTGTAAATSPRGVGPGPVRGTAQPDIALEPGPFAWIGAELQRNGRFRLPSESSLPLLARYGNPAVERSGEWRRFWVGRYGPAGRSWAPLSWSTNSCGAGAPPEVESAPWSSGFSATHVESSTLLSPSSLPLLDRWIVPRDEVPAPQALGLVPVVECPAWQPRRPVTFFRIDSERDTFHLLECDGSVSPEAIDRLSVMARPPGVSRPRLPLADEPSPDAPAGEWSRGIKLLHPRLVWAIQQIASAYPHRAVYVVSGYRPGSGASFHARGRAIDLQIVGVPNERTFELCRSLNDVACGYYPNDGFVHVDVRSFGAGKLYWVDAAYPGEPSRYVDAWPGVVDGGALVHGGEP